MNTKRINYLKEFVSENRWNNFNRVVDLRTRHLTVVLEDIFQAHNTSAVLRSCDCFGIQDVHIIENRNKYKVNPDIALGSSQWITMHRHSSEEENTLNCINELKRQGFWIVATSPHEDGITVDSRVASDNKRTSTKKRENYNINELPVDKKIALVFGTELKGISETVIEHADAFVKIPMYGFTESFNISVSVALCLYELSTRIRNSNTKWELSGEEKDIILLDWLRTSIHKVELIEEEFEKRES